MPDTRPKIRIGNDNYIGLVNFCYFDVIEISIFDYQDTICKDDIIRISVDITIFLELLKKNFYYIFIDKRQDNKIVGMIFDFHFNKKASNEKPKIPINQEKIFEQINVMLKSATRNFNLDKTGI